MNVRVVNANAVHVAAVEDVSEGGLRLAMDGHIMPGGEVVIATDEHEIDGVVRYCTVRRPGEYQLGVEFTGDYRWSTSHNWPECRASAPACGAPESRSATTPEEAPMIDVAFAVIHPD